MQRRRNMATSRLSCLPTCCKTSICRCRRLWPHRMVTCSRGEGLRRPAVGCDSRRRHACGWARRARSARLTTTSATRSSLRSAAGKCWGEGMPPFPCSGYSALPACAHLCRRQPSTLPLPCCPPLQEAHAVLGPRPAAPPLLLPKWAQRHIMCSAASPFLLMRTWRKRPIHPIPSCTRPADTHLLRRRSRVNMHAPPEQQRAAFPLFARAAAAEAVLAPGDVIFFPSRCASFSPCSTPSERLHSPAGLTLGHFGSHSKLLPALPCAALHCAVPGAAGGRTTRRAWTPRCPSPAALRPKNPCGLALCSSPCAGSLTCPHTCGRPSCKPAQPSRVLRWCIYDGGML